jgi:hypothetical protein
VIDDCLVVPHRVVTLTIAPARQNPPLALNRTLRRPARTPHAQHGSGSRTEATPQTRPRGSGESVGSLGALSGNRFV